MTWSVNVVELLPPALLAVTVYVPNGVTAVGVPLISPVVVFNVKPAGRVGEIDQEVTSPPLAVGVIVGIIEPFCKVNELGLYVTPAGAATMTVMVTVAVALPPEFVAVTV